MTELMTSPAPSIATGDAPYFAMLDAVTVPICMHRGERIIFANEAFEQLCGLSRAALRQKQFHDVVTQESRDSVRAEGEALMRGVAVPPPRELSLLVEGGAGSRLVEATVSRVPINGHRTVMMTFQDLTERKRAEARDKHLRRLLGQIMDGGPVPTFVIDAAHRVVHWNHACAMITGIPAARMQGTTNQWSAFYPNERPVMADLIVDGALDGNLETHYKGKFRSSAIIPGAYEAEDFFPQFGEKGCWLFFTAAPLRDAQGKLLGAIETLQDVTKRHEAEDALRRHQAELERLVAERTAQLSEARDQLIQSEKLASIGQLAAGVAHEINNPIGFVLSNVGSLETYAGSLFDMLRAYENAEASVADPELRASLSARRESLDIDFIREDVPNLIVESKQGLARVKKIVQDLKDFSHVDNVQEWRWANLHDGIEATLKVLAHEIEPRAEVVKEFGALPEVECLPLQLNQVFMNLLANATQAMDESRGRIVIRSGSDGVLAWIEFEDNGRGIAQDIQPRVFEPFFTTRPIGQGTGLGLSMAYGILHNHNGRITFHSEPGRGSTFRVELPVHHFPPSAPTAG